MTTECLRHAAALHDPAETSSDRLRETVVAVVVAVLIVIPVALGALSFF